MPTIAELTIDLHANVAALRSDFAKAQRETQRFTSGVTAGFRNFGRLLSGLGLAIGVRELISFGAEAVRSTGALADMAAQLQVSVEGLQELQFAAKSSSVEQAELESALMKLSGSLGDAARGSRSAQAAFREMGVAFADSSGRARSNEEVLRDIAEAYRNAGDKTAFLSNMQDVLGKSASRLIPMFEGGAAGLDAMSQKARELGLVLSDDLVKSAKEAADQWDLAMAVFETRMKAATLELLKFIGLLNRTKTEELQLKIEETAEKRDRVIDMLNDPRAVLRVGKDNLLAEINALNDSVQKMQTELQELLNPSAPLPVVVTNPPIGGQTRGDGGGGRSGDEFPLGQDFIPPQKPLSPAQQKIIDEALSGGSIGMLPTLLQETGMEAEELAASVGDLTRSLGEAALGMRDWRDVALSTVADLLNGISNQLLQMAGIGGGGGGGIGGLFGDVIGGLVGGLFGGGLTADPFPGTTGRARGGRVYAGRAYTVGERGREWFTPDENGFVGAAAASGGMIVNIDARGATRDAIAGIRRELRALNASVERRVDARVMDSRRRGGDFGRTLK